MPYMNQEKKAKIAELVKPILKKYNLKGSLSIYNYSTICLNLKSGKIDFIDNYNKKLIEDNHKIYGYDKKRTIDYGFMQVNEFTVKERFTGDAKNALLELKDALLSANWYDESEPMTVYYDIVYYISINIGKYDKDYVVTE